MTLPSCAVPPATDPVGPLTHNTGAELETAHHFVTLARPRRVRSSSVEAADKPDVSPRLYGAVQGAAQETPSTKPAAYEDPLRVFTHIVTQVPAIRSQAAQHPDIGSTGLLASLQPDQFARIDAQCPGKPFQYRDRSRNFGAFDGAQITGA